MTTWNRDDSDLSTLTGIASTTVGNLRLTGSTIGHISDTDILTFSSNALAITASSGLTLKDSDILLKNSGDSTTITLDASSGIITAKQLTMDVGGTITLPDNDKITLGNSGDLEIYHDGSNSYIKDVGTGDLRIVSSSGYIYLENNSDDVMKFILDDDSGISSIEGDLILTGAASISMLSNGSGYVHLDSVTKITLDADSGEIELKDGGVEFGSLNNSSGNLLLKSGTTTALTFSGANATFAGNLTVGSIAAGDGSSENFVVEQSGLLLKRTASEVRSDLGISDAEIVDWAGAGAGTIHATNYVDNNTNQLTTFTVSATTDTTPTTISQGDDLFFEAGTGITCTTTADGTVTIENTVTDTNTTYTGGTNLTLDSTTFNVDDAFLINDDDDTTTGTITAGGFTTTGTWTMDTSAGGTTGITNINITNAFTDDDVTIMSAGAIKEKIEGYGYSTTSGTVTSVGTTGTVNGVTLTGTVTSSGNLALGGTLAINNDDWSGTDLSVANGGTGASTLTDNSILTGTGTSAVTAEGNLTFDGTKLAIQGCVGFTQIAETFSDDTLLTTGGTDDTQIDFRSSNKIYLAVTGDINDINLIFPAVSGNFVLILKYDGDHDIDSWKAWASDLSAAGFANVFWPGGTEPATTSSGTDIFSFYWDNTNEICYGVASLDFQAGD